jgi:diguanylate cyclase (GGDEF)-like protein
MGGYDELARRRPRRRLAPHGESTGAFADAATDLAAAAEDRRLAAADRRRAAEFLSNVYRDEVTGVLNRGAGREQMRAEIDRALRAATPLAVIFFDVDGLKFINDAHGHRRGDEVLAAAGTALRSSLRSYDLIVRYGGDEFVCALPGGTEETASESILRTERALHELIPSATLSAGHAQLLPGDTLDIVVDRADADLYRQRAHRSGGSDHGQVPSTAHRDVQRIPGQAALPCGACGGTIPLSAFRNEDVGPETRSAACSRCGATTLIQVIHSTSNVVAPGASLLPPPS